MYRPLLALVFVATSAGCTTESDRGVGARPIELLNVSYDASWELFEAYNPAFVKDWRDTTGSDVSIRQLHAGTRTQVQAVLGGLQADVVTFGSARDVDALRQRGGLLKADWQRRLPFNSVPYTSTIVLLVRAGNPKAIGDWGDLARPTVGVVTPDPKSCAGGRWNYLAGWIWALRQPQGSEASASTFLSALYRNAVAMDADARHAAATFVGQGVGDVLITWEHEALRLARAHPYAFEVVMPSASVLAEPAVSVVDRNVDLHGTRSLAESYLERLFTPWGQELAAANYYRPRDPAVAARHAATFATLDMVTVDEAFGGWEKAHVVHFAQGGVYDQIRGGRR